MSDATGFTIELVTERAAVPMTSDEWNALVAANETNTVFQTYEWFDAWWNVFGASRRLFMLVVREAGIVRGFAALTLRRSQYGWRQLEFAGTGSADYLDFVLPHDKPRALLAICAFLRARRWRWDRLALGNIPGESSTLPALTAATDAHGLHVVDEVKVPCPTLMLQSEDSLARRLVDKYSLRRPFNWFSKRGKVEFRHVTSIEEIEKLLPEFFDQHRRRWRSIGKDSLFDQAKHQRFYELLAQSLHVRGWLQFSIVTWRGEAIAFHFGFDYGGCVTWYKPSFEVRYAEHSPGLLLTRQLIEDGLQREKREFDFTGGEEAFKGRFASQVRSNVYLSVYPGRAHRVIAVALRDARKLAGSLRRRLAKRMRASGTVAPQPAADGAA
jgi:CelD/BcsL family acetyltransferase involved in cellulose biosynthesis